MSFKNDLHIIGLTSVLLFSSTSFIRMRQTSYEAFSIKTNGQCRYKYLVLKNTDSTKKFSETDIIKMLEFFLLTSYLLCFVDVVFNRQSAYLWVQTVLPFSPTCAFIRMRHTSYRGFSRKMKRSSFNFMFHYIVDNISLNRSRFGDAVDLSH